MTEKPIWSTGNPPSDSQGLIFPQKHELRGWNFFLEFSVMYLTV